MLRLLPKDIVNYIYTIIHQGNTQDIVNEYIQKVSVVEYSPFLNENNCHVGIKLLLYGNNAYHSFNYRNILVHSYRLCNVYRSHIGCAKIPKRYRYSLTQEEFESMLVSTPTK